MERLKGRWRLFILALLFLALVLLALNQNRVSVDTTITRADRTLSSGHLLQTKHLPRSPNRPKFKYHPLTEKDIQSVEKFLFFTGYPRSGHSIIGSLIDAHPNVVLSTGYFLFKQLSDKENSPHSKRALFGQIHHKSCSYSNISPIRGGKGYTLDVPGGWSGKFRKLKVIGDKSAKATTDAYNKFNTSEFKHLYEQLQRLVRVPLLVIHVVRDPFDMIATQALYQQSVNESGQQVKANFTAENKMANPQLLGKVTRLYLKLARAVSEMVPLCNMSVLEIHNEDLVWNPARTVNRICEFLGVECPVQYVEACVRKVFPEVSHTRDRVKWPPRLKNQIEKELKKYPFFDRYFV